MRRMLISLGFVAGTLLLSVSASPAAVFNVSDVAGLQSALTAAGTNGEDDTINVAAGTYNIPATLIYGSAETNALAVVGAGAASTFLDGGGTLRVLNIFGNGDITISGLTVRNGSSTGEGAGLNGNSGGTFTISDCVFSGNHATATHGGGFFIGLGDLTITGSTFSNNTAALLGGGGSSTVTGTVAVSSSTFSGNTAGAGGGFYSDGASTFSVTGSSFSGNTTNIGNQGGGLFVSHIGPGTLTLSDSTFSGNLASGSCAFVDIAVGIMAVARGPTFITRNLVADNTTACQGHGAGILLTHTPSADTVVVADNIFSGNASGPGSTFGPVHLSTQRGALNVVNNTFSGNDSGEPTTADVFLDVIQDTGSANVSNNIFFGAAGEDELEIRNDGNANLITSPATFRNNIVDPFQVTFTPGGGVSESGNFEADPLFTDLAGGDFHLLEGSPAIDGGLSTAPGIQLLDFDGDDRIIGAAVDIGADEFIPPNPATFFPATATLEIPEVQLGSKAYQVRMTRLDEPGHVFMLTGARKMTATAAPSALFDTATGVLDIAVVRIQGSARTYHVLMKKRPGSYIFDLTRASKN